MGSLGKHSIAPGLKKRKRSETPPEQIASGDEAKYVGQPSVWRTVTQIMRKLQ
jgi:alkylated DNA nucleotide flippase Atl1